MQIVAALFIDEINLRQVPGPSTRIDLSGIQFSPDAALEVTYHRAGEQIARNVQPLQIEPGKFGYRLVRAEIEVADYGMVEAHCRLDLGPVTVVPYTLLPPG